jgi:hypothetical protein
MGNPQAALGSRLTGSLSARYLTIKSATQQGGRNLACEWRGNEILSLDNNVCF